MLVAKAKINSIYLTLFSSIFILFAFFKPIYGTTDDYILNSWLSGSYTGNQENESIFITPIFSNLMSFCYELSSAISWYPLTLLLITFLSVLRLIKFVKNTASLQQGVKYFNYLVLISFLVWSFLGITYTATAIIAGVAGWISIVDSLKNEDKRNIIYGFILIIVSIIIRPESFIGATLIVIPFLFTRLKLNRTNVLKLAALAIAVSIIFIANYFLEKNQSLEIMDYRVWAKKVQMFAGRPRMEAAAKVIGESGWTPSQYNLFVGLAYFDQKTFNTTWIDSGIKATQKLNNRPVVNSEKIQLIVKEYINSTTVFFYALLIVGVLLLLSLRRIRHPIVLVISILNFGLIHLLSGLFLHNVSRVTVPFIVFFILSLSYSLSPILNRRFIMSINLLLVFILSTYFLKLNNTNDIKIINSGKYRSALVNDLSNKIILIHGNQEYSQNSNPYIAAKKDLNPNVFMVGNWDTFSPHWYKRANKLGLYEKSITDNLLSNPNVLWSGPTVPNTTLNLINYLKEAGYDVIDPVKVGLLPNGNELWKFSNSGEKNAT
jgi:hypothetical protein